MHKHPLILGHRFHSVASFAYGPMPTTNLSHMPDDGCKQVRLERGPLRRSSLTCYFWQPSRTVLSAPLHRRLSPPRRFVSPRPGLERERLAMRCIWFVTRFLRVEAAGARLARSAGHLSDR